MVWPRRSATYFACAAIAACGPVASVRKVDVTPQSRPAPSAVDSVLSAAPSASASTAPSASAAPSSRVFSVAGEIVFHPAAAPAKQTMLGKKTNFGGISADGSAWVTGYDQHGILASAVHPNGLTFAASSIRRAIFSPSGTRVALLQYLGPYRVLSVADGKLVYAGNASPCDLRFVSDDVFIFHSESKDGHARLYRVDMTLKRDPVAIGAERRADDCTSSRDGATWLVHSEDEQGTIDVVDGATGSARRLYSPVNRNGLQYALSPVADRICLGRQGGADVRCIRVADGVREDVEVDPPYPEVEFDPDGQRLIVWRTVSPPGSDNFRSAAIADLHDGTLRFARALRGHSGGSMHLLAGGHLFAAGSASGIEVFDLDAATRTFVARSPFYSVYPLAGHPRSFVGGSEGAGGGALEDMWLVDVP